MSTKITFNGREYASLEAMPPEVRRAYQQVMGMFADKDGDGVPDLFQGGAGPTVVQQSSFVVNGREYASREAMPPDVRRMYDDAMAELAKLDGAVTGGTPAPVPPPTPEPAPLRIRGGAEAPRFGADTPGGIPLPWVLVVILLIALAWALMR